MQVQDESSKLYQLVPVEESKYKSTWQQRTAQCLWEFALLGMVFGVGFVYFHYHPIQLLSEQPGITTTR